jgi:hypothetical protein
VRDQRREVTLDTSHTVKSRDSVARTTVGRSNVVRTELSPSQSVNATQQVPLTHQAPHMLARDPSLDAQCHTVLEREREERERRRRARKDEILHRQRAYGRTAEQPDSSQSDDDTPHADFQV